MQILIEGIGALGGTIAARAIRTGLPVRLAARNTDSAEALRRSGLRVSGIGGPGAEPGEDELSEGVGPVSAPPLDFGSSAATRCWRMVMSWV